MILEDNNETVKIKLKNNDKNIVDLKGGMEAIAGGTK